MGIHLKRKKLGYKSDELGKKTNKKTLTDSNSPKVMKVPILLYLVLCPFSFSNKTMIYNKSYKDSERNNFPKKTKRIY